MYFFTLAAGIDFASDATSQLHVLGEDSDALGVDGAEVGVLEELYDEVLARHLQCHHGALLEADLGAILLGKLANQTAEGRLAKQELGGLLVLADLAQSLGARPVAIRLLELLHVGHDIRGSDRSEVLGRLLASQGLARGFAASAVALDSGVLGTSHNGRFGWILLV